MKNHVTKLVFLISISIFLFGCEKEDSMVSTEVEKEALLKNSTSKDIENPEEEFGDIEQEEIVKISHNYYYNEREFNVTYTYNQIEDEITDVSGDLEMAETLFTKEESGTTLLFDKLEEDSKEISVRVFDSEEEMTAYMEKHLELELPKEEEEGQETENKGFRCNSYDYWGHGNFYFYKHAYYSSQMNSLRRTSRRATGNHWVGSGNNDQMSSAIITKPYWYNGYLRLKEHSCYGGKSLNFYIPGYYYWSSYGIKNLSWYTLKWKWFKKISWNDQVSSYQGWCWY
ncbi:hypothetical protein [Aquimarina pacifica]|uniref:hypothetical protein n=1 Tax=Aquimarina pacifica TaxID=1296415 RepID=UPI00046FFD39|nr:hypothetical protein [Aquimarina pacifica]